MAIVIQDILGTDAFSGSRIVINANFAAIVSEITTLETNFGISLASGNLDVSAAVGGVIKAKTVAANTIQLPATGVPTIILTGSTGAMTGTTLSLATSLTVPAISVDNLTCTSLGNSIFNGGATFNALVKIRDGVALNKIDLGAITTHTVLNSDCVLLFSPTGSSPDSLVLAADPSLVDGHVITLIPKNNTYCTLDTTLLLGAWASIAFTGGAYKCSITLMYSLSDLKWIVIDSSNMTMS